VGRDAQVWFLVVVERQRLGLAPEGLAEPAVLDAGQVLDQAQQVGPRRHHRSPQLFVVEAVEFQSTTSRCRSRLTGRLGRVPVNSSRSSTAATAPPAAVQQGRHLPDISRTGQDASAIAALRMWLGCAADHARARGRVATVPRRPVFEFAGPRGVAGLGRAPRTLITRLASAQLDLVRTSCTPSRRLAPLAASQACGRRSGAVLGRAATENDAVPD
jgi:hypothetical protein